MGILDLITGGLGMGASAGKPWFQRLAQNTNMGDLLSQFGMEGVGRTQGNLGKMGQGSLQDFLSALKPQGGSPEGAPPQQAPAPMQGAGTQPPGLAALIQQYMQQQQGR